MYTQEEYLYGWLLYLLGVTIVMACGWVLTSFIPNKETQKLLRVIAAVTLVTPWYASADMEYLAPAWIIAGFEGLVDGTEAFWRAGGPLCVALAVAVSVSIVWHVFTKLRGRVES